MSTFRSQLLWRATFAIAFTAPAAACSLTTATDGLSGGQSHDDLRPEDGGSGPDADAPQDGGKTDGSPLDAGAHDHDAAPPADTSSPCSNGKIACNGSCIDPSTDPHNCNGCGNLCSSGICNSVISESMATQPSLWSFNGTAGYNASAPSAQLTAASSVNAAGTVIYSHAIPIDGFDVHFQFRMGLQGGWRSDGIAFVLEQDGPTVVGSSGEGLGVSGLTGYGVELDIFNNGKCGDTSDDHVGVDRLSICNGGAPISLAAQDITGSIDLADTHWHDANIKLSGGAISVSIDNTSFLSGVALPVFRTGDSYWLGFGGGTGNIVGAGTSGGYRQEVKDITITFPTPRCL